MATCDTWLAVFSAILLIVQFVNRVDAKPVDIPRVFVSVTARLGLLRHVSRAALAERL